MQTEIDFIAVCQQFVEFQFAQHGTQSCLRKLRSLVDVIGNFHDRLAGIDDTQKNDGVDFQGDVVARDDVLRRDLQGFLPQRNAHHAIDRSEHQDDARPFFPIQQASQPKDNAPLVLGQDLDRAQQVKGNNNDDDDRQVDWHLASKPGLSGLLLGRIVSQMNALVAPFPTNDGYLRRCAFGLAGRAKLEKAARKCRVSLRIGPEPRKAQSSGL